MKGKELTQRLFTNLSIRTYAVNDVFHIHSEIFNKYEGVMLADIKLSPYEARIIKDRLEEFLSQQQ